jgi:hypothetical protein
MRFKVQQLDDCFAVVDTYEFGHPTRIKATTHEIADEWASKLNVLTEELLQCDSRTGRRKAKALWKEMMAQHDSAFESRLRRH